ncbi:tetratricopeptide repeat protein [Clostridium acetobutylicum]|uniref:tetratricopeptide repeat protein n=1 Tax=Clostridium acetobutylicum TaxID=1488 RepID=UPI001F4BF002|nr:tetratricopeptide repeat protein [Clostridium acetobutylicum]NRY55073.1 tetratricopeptide (TPR) repeat protein [Clostridium acetobutylicum]
MYRIRTSSKIKKIIDEIGVSQTKLACKYLGRATINKIIRGERPLNAAQAYKFIQRFKDFGYNADIELILGIPTKTIDSTVKKFLSNTKKHYLEFDKLIDKLYKDKAIEVIWNVIEKLDIQDVYKNANIILKYLTKLMQYDLDADIYLKVNIELIKIYTATANYERAITAFNSLKNFSILDRETKVKCFLNVALAYYNLREYKSSIDIASRVMKLKIFDKYYFKASIIKANVLYTDGRINESIKEYEKIAIKAEKYHFIEYVATSESNIGYVFTEQNKFNEAKLHLDEAMKLFDSLNNYYKLNVYDNVFGFKIKNNTADFDTFKKVILLAYDTNDKFRIKNNVKQFVNYAIRNKKSKEIFTKIIDFLNPKGIDLDSSLKLEIMEYVSGNTFESVLK